MFSKLFTSLMFLCLTNVYSKTIINGVIINNSQENFIFNNCSSYGYIESTIKPILYAGETQEMIIRAYDTDPYFTSGTCYYNDFFIVWHKNDLLYEEFYGIDITTSNNNTNGIPIIVYPGEIKWIIYIT